MAAPKRMFSNRQLYWRRSFVPKIILIFFNFFPLISISVSFDPVYYAFAPTRAEALSDAFV